MNTYPSLNVAVYDLRKRGYRLDFYYQSGSVFCIPLNLRIQFKDVRIEESYSFPSLQQPGCFNIVYALSTDNGNRGLLYNCTGSISQAFSNMPAAEINHEADCR